MTKLNKTLMFGAVVLAIVAMTQFFALDFAAACGWGNNSGGEAYVPQRRDSQGFWAQKSAVSETQAREIATSYVKKLNPSLGIGKVTDSGGFYEVEILNESQEIVQLLGVDKLSGRLVVLN